jgi:predicted SnoaL-like aldol condensation-catalyzing enzyme
MKKIFIALLAGAFIIFTSCNDQTAGTSDGMSEQAQKNLEASRVVSKAFETGDVSGIDSVVAENFVDHTSDRGDVRGRDSLKAMITMVNQNYPDMKMEVMKEFADDNYVFTQMHFTGTSDGAMGMPPGPFDMRAIQVVRFENGKAVEHWEYMDMQDMMKMMNQMQPPADTTKNN